jgi:hypothetical protein
MSEVRQMGEAMRRFRDGEPPLGTPPDIAIHIHPPEEMDVGLDKPAEQVYTEDRLDDEG